MKILVDENMAAEAADIFRRYGHDAISIAAIPSLRGTKDPQVMNKCDVEGRVLVTLDRDFYNTDVYPPSSHSGIIIFHLRSLTKQSMLLGVEALCQYMEKNRVSPKGELWIFDGDNVFTVSKSSYIHGDGISPKFRPVPLTTVKPLTKRERQTERARERADARRRPNVNKRGRSSVSDDEMEFTGSLSRLGDRIPKEVWDSLRDSIS